MGRNSGGVTSSGKGGSSGGSKGATEKGYTAKMVKNIVGMEQKYRRNKDIHVFCEKTKGRLGCISRCCVKGFCGCEQNGI